jgi:hypothetical protein
MNGGQRLRGLPLRTANVDVGLGALLVLVIAGEKGEGMKGESEKG